MNFDYDQETHSDHDKNYDENHDENHTDEEAAINPDDYELAEEEMEFKKYHDLINAYIIHINSLNNKQTNLFEGIDYKDKTSTNRNLEMFYDELYKYNIANKKNNEKFITLYDPQLYKQLYEISNDEPLYQVTCNMNTDNEERGVTHSLITALLFVTGHDNWTEIPWQVIQITTFI